MISRFKKSNALPGGDQRVAARMALGFVAAVLCLAVVLAGASMGMSGSLAFSQPSPSGSSPTGPEGPSIAFVNPPILEEGYVPVIADRDDKVDSDYHIVAWTGGVIEDPIIEAAVQPMVTTPMGDRIPLGNEITVGTLSPVAGSPHSWELYWDIPQTVPNGDAIMTVRLFEDGILGFEEVANHAIDVTIDKEADTTELVWPTQNGPIGFFKPRGGSFRSYVDFTTSHPGAEFGTRADAYYSTSDPGSVPTWSLCLTASGSNNTGGTCTLTGKDLGSQVTALMTEAQTCRTTGLCLLVQASNDAHVVRPYFVDPHELTLDIEFRTTTESPMVGRQIAGDRAPTGPDGTDADKCIAIQAVVRDELDRPVLGANVDWHITGPNDQLQFGQEDVEANLLFDNSSSTYKVADKGGHQSEVGRNCDPEQDEPDSPRTQGEQGDHNVPVRDDIKHRETSSGTGLDGGSGAPRGGWWTDIYSPSVGLTQVTAWIDNEQVPDDSVNPDADDDVMQDDEPRDTLTAQWLPENATITADPLGGSGPAGSCQRYVLKLRAGTTPVRNLNVDIHARGPNNDLDFCEPTDGSIRQAPDTASANHTGEDTGESAHAGDPPQVQHTEGEADDAGNFVFGIVSPEAGDTTITAWIDGTKGNNDDAQGAAPAEPAVTFSHSWASSTGDVEVSFVSPSGFGGDGNAGGDEISAKDDGAPGYHIVTRVDAPAAIEGVELLIAPSGSQTFSSLGQMSRIGNSDTYELNWAVDLADGNYVLRARILGTNVIEERAVTVNNQTATAPPDQPANQQAETASIANPAVGAGVAFVNRSVEINGRASAGAEGVDLFYTKAPAKDTVASAAWISCGYADLNGGGTAVQDFKGNCALAGSDQPGQVTGVAAITFDCLEPAGNATPGGTPGRCQGGRDAGDAHRIFGFEAQPIVNVEPAEAAAQPGDCQRMVMTIRDQTGQAIGGVNVDLHARGPEDNVDFCDPEDGPAHQRGAPNEGGHEVEAGQEDQGYHDEATGADTSHVEGTNNPSGRFVFGLSSDVEGDTELLAWFDRADNDVKDADEAEDTSIVHWETAGGGGACDISGSAGPDTLTGTEASERICGFGGNDTITGGGGNDTIAAGGGRDVVRGNAGADLVQGSSGFDRLFGGGGGDQLRGGGGNDTIRGHRGNDRLFGHGGRDALGGGPGRDTCNGGKGRDRASGCESTRSARRGFTGFAARTKLI